MEDEIRVSVNSDADLVVARAEGRALAQRLGFRPPDPTLIATAISELARNLVVHVGHGEVVMRALVEDRRYGMVVIVCDEGQGIADVESALREGRASHGGLGLGLPGARRLMDEFEVDSRPGEGTTVTMRKWRQRDELELLREKRERRVERPGLA
jgi:serine/threonine-protein kinase RsbT